MNLYSNNNIEEEILNNYVNLWRVIIGDKKMMVRSKISNNCKFKEKELWRKELRTCECGVTFYPTWLRKKYCGHRDKDGCAHKRFMEGIKKSLEARWGKINKIRWKNKEF